MGQFGPNGGTRGWGNLDPFEQAQRAGSQAFSTTQNALMKNSRADPATYNPMYYNPAMMGAAGYQAHMQGDAPAIADHMGAYQNPFQQQVIDRTTAGMQDSLDRNLEMNKANAAASGAFGGGRHGLTDAVTYAETTRGIGDMEAGLRKQGWDTAAALGAQDVGNILGVRSANQQARNMQRQYNAGNQQQRNLQNQQAQNQARQFRAQSANTARQYNTGEQNRFRQNQFSNALAGAGMLSGLGGQAFGWGQDLLGQQQAQGEAAQDANQQAMDDAARQAQQADPMTWLGNLSAALQGLPISGNTTTSGSGTSPGPSNAATGAGIVGELLGK